MYIKFTSLPNLIFLFPIIHYHRNGNLKNNRTFDILIFLTLYLYKLNCNLYISPRSSSTQYTACKLETLTPQKFACPPHFSY